MQDPSGLASGAPESRPPTALVLSPSVGGSFFETLLTGLAREVVTAGGRLIVIETRQRFSDRDEEGTREDFAEPIAWAKADGIITITTAVSEGYVERARTASKPVVLLSSPQPDEQSIPLVRPDNRAGARMAVDHLVEHGHTRIGFVGNRAHSDVHERYEAFQDTLETHGLKADPKLLYGTPNNSAGGGGVAATAFLASDIRPTALVVATDSNAIGLMSVLSERGLRVPRDLAVVAFDNAMGGTLETPALSSVELRFDRVGALAGRTLLKAIRGEEVPAGDLTPNAAVLMCRESCGCGADSRREDDTTHIDTSGPDPEKAIFRHRLADVLQVELYSGDEAADQRASNNVERLVRDAVELLDLGAGATAARIRSFTTLLLRLATNPDTVRRVVNVMTEYSHWMASQSAPGGVERAAVPSNIAAALWKAQSTSMLRHAEHYDEALAKQFAVDAGMLGSTGSDPRDLKWLAGTTAKAGALALWTEGTPGGTLTVVGEFTRTAGPLNLVGSELTSEHFPPDELVWLPDPAQHEVCVVVPVHTPEKDWGMLAVVVSIDPSVIRDTHQHWAAMLSAALESQCRQEELRRSALYDSLTGLPNRQLLREHLEDAIEQHQEIGTPFSVLFLDLDGFKLINDSLGHQIGDRVLQTVATQVSHALRSGDVATRFGGDEFVVLLTDTESHEATSVAERIKKGFEQVFVFDDHEIAIRASIGIASSAVQYTTADAVLRDADAAMYRAKSVAPGTIEHFDAPVNGDLIQSSALAQDVLLGLERDEFEVHYQPIVNLDTGRTDRFEALVRWRHPTQGLLEPAQFLDVIKESSLILQVGHRVLDEVCRSLAEWGPRVANVGINISDKEFWNQHLLEHVLKALDTHGVAPERLTLEITESTLMRRPEIALRLMNKLHEAGIALHIDNFGTGFSSVEMLRRFPIAAFKIDRSFIGALSGAENSSALITSLVKLGKALGMSVLAEGVETEEQRELLRGLGCDTGQGFLFMPAVTGDRVAELLERPLHESDSA